MIIIDSSFEHSLNNESENDAILLVVDFNHPDLTDKEKKSLAFNDHVKSRFLLYQIKAFFVIESK